MLRKGDETPRKDSDKDGPLRVEDVISHAAAKPRIVNVWDFIGESDAESVGASSTRSPVDGEALTVLPLDIDESFKVPAEKFQEPCEPISTSGGTASFYHICYRSGQEPAGRDGEFYVGKDLSHASDELEFYFHLQHAMDQDSRYDHFAEMAMQCPGVTQIICRSPKDKSMEVRNLLLLENLRNGYEKMRLVDVKMGAETSVACWKGKSRLHAWKNARVDQRTNSLVEGYRLEGMECPPRAIQDRIDAVNVGSQGRMRSKIISGKAAKRFLLQRLRGQEFLAAWCDVSALGAGAESHAHAAVWSAIEQVGKLLRVAVDLPVPQQWIGSSIAMSLEVGRLCKATEAPRVVVKAFDWGRAELSTVEMHNALPPESKRERIKFWRQYIRAVCRFYWELCRIASHRCCCAAWTAFVFELRIEPVSIVRAALLGKTVSEVRGVGLFQLPSTGIKGGSASIVLPLVAPKNTAPATPGGSASNKSMVGALHILVSAPEGGRCGEGAVIVEVRGATQLPADLDTAGAAIVIVRVLGFERAGDARMHCEKYRGGHPEPIPRGRTYAQATAPGKVIAGTMVWESSLEFFGLGDDAVASQKRVAALLPKGFAASGESPQSLNQWPQATNGTSEEARRDDPWPELLPPTVGDQSQMESVAQVFGNHLVPWLDENAEVPAGWL